jgi:2-dehydro-3-deoxy-D-arabinonate dehydratase
MKIIRTINGVSKNTYVISNKKTYLISDALSFLLSSNKEQEFIKQVGVDPMSFLLQGSMEKVITPFDPPEIWGSGISYYISRKRYSEKNVAMIEGKTIYETVYDAERPETFFKGTARCVIGHNGQIRVRRDSNWTLPEPELAVVIDFSGKILAYTIFDDVSARDIEAENPLYLPQSKIYDESSAFGPFLVTPEEFGNPYEKNISMKIYRNNNVLFEGKTSTSNMKTKIEKQIHFLLIDNHVPDGTILTTGTSIIPSREKGLNEGDIVEISIDCLGSLVTKVTKHSFGTKRI